MQREQAPTDLHQALAAVTSVFGPVVVIPTATAEDPSDERPVAAA